MSTYLVVRIWLAGCIVTLYSTLGRALSVSPSSITTPPRRPPDTPSITELLCLAIRNNEPDGGLLVLFSPSGAEATPVGICTSINNMHGGVISQLPGIPMGRVAIDPIKPHWHCAASHRTAPHRRALLHTSPERSRYTLSVTVTVSPVHCQ